MFEAISAVSAVVTVIVALTLAIRHSIRSENFYIDCPMCGMEREYSRDLAIQRINNLTAAELVARHRDDARCRKWEKVPAEMGKNQYGNSVVLRWEQRVTAGCNADLIWLYLRHPYVVQCFRNKAVLEQAQATEKALMDASGEMLPTEPIPDNVVEMPAQKVR